jgi:hypothetical protein
MFMENTKGKDEGKYLLNNINSNRKNINLKPDIVFKANREFNCIFTAVRKRS